MDMIKIDGSRKSGSGQVREVRGIALSSMLKERRVSERMAKVCAEALKKRAYDLRIKVIYDISEKPAYKKPALQAGAALALWAETKTGCRLGSDMAGARGRSILIVPEITEHVEARLWLAGKILQAGTEVLGNRITSHGIGYRK
jgi:RNA 3'-terminal phosphate cyclase